VEIIAKARPFGTELRLLTLGLWGFGGIGLFTVYKMYLSGDSKTGFEQLIDNDGWEHATLILLLAFALPLACIGAGGALSLLRSKLGGIKIQRATGETIVFKGLDAVPNPDICERFWKFSTLILADPETRQVLLEQVAELAEEIAVSKSKERVKIALANAAAGSRMLILAPKIGKEVFGTAPENNKESTLEKARKEVGKTWLERTAENYEKVPNFIWQSIDLLDGEWIVAVGPSPTAPRFAITTQRIFIYERDISSCCGRDLNDAY
jgi:hypothetical protein